ncbi:MAG: DinB family protein, partial [bacterium]
EALKSQRREMLDLLSSLNEEQALYRYAEGKWSVKEIVGHLIDAERVFVYRAMCFARKETAFLPGMDENYYVKNANFDKRALADLLDEYQNVRAATISFFANMDAETGLRRGTANESEFTVRSLLCIIAGHERHHLNFLKERYC